MSISFSHFLNPLCWASLFMMFLHISCGELRPPTTGTETKIITYLDDVQPLMQRRCVKCHGDTNPEGNYSLTSYLNVLGPGQDDHRNAIAGDEQCRLLSIFLSEGKSLQHISFFVPAASELMPGETLESRRDTEFNILHDWVVKYRLAYFKPIIHPSSWLNPEDRNSQEFHGGNLRAMNWDTSTCQDCHGKNFSGGTAMRSCLNCHQQGVQGCTVCHGAANQYDQRYYAPPTDLSWNIGRRYPGVGAHQDHLAPQPRAENVECWDCHIVPRGLRDAGHPRRDLKAILPFSDKARGKTRGSHIDTKPEYRRESATCTNVYCHSLDGAVIKIWSWTLPIKVECNSCHGLPPSRTLTGKKHSEVIDCAFCHRSAYDNEGRLIPSKHINGRVDL